MRPVSSNPPPPAGSSGTPPTFTQGERVRYTLTKRLSPSKAIVHVKGTKVVAEIPTGVPERGVATILTTTPKLTLRLASNDTTGKAAQSPASSPAAHNATGAFTQEKEMLLAHGVKANARNLSYLRTVLRHAGTSLSNQQTRFILSLIGKGIYLPPARLTTILNADAFSQLLCALRGKNTNDEHSRDDNSIKLTLGHLLPSLTGRDFAQQISRYITSNGLLSVWTLLFETLANKDDAKNAANNMKDLITLLKENTQNEKGATDTYFLPLFITIDERVERIDVSIEKRNKKKGFNRRDTIMITAYDDDAPIVEIEMQREKTTYAFHLRFFTKEMLALYRARKQELLDALDKKALSLPVSLSESYYH